MTAVGRDPWVETPRYRMLPLSILLHTTSQAETSLSRSNPSNMSDTRLDEELSEDDVAMETLAAGCCAKNSQKQLSHAAQLPQALSQQIQS